jgi:hypothetical protein
MAKVKELIKALGEYNPDAKVFIDGVSTFDICYGTKEGCVKETCEFVHIKRDEEKIKKAFQECNGT